MSASTPVGPHLFWIISRGAGTTALVLSSVTVCVGLFMAGRIGSGDAVSRRAYHEVLSLSVMVAIAVHGLVLVGDGVLHPGLLDVTVPFLWSYARLATTLGIVAGWALIFLGLSFYLRDRIGRSRFKLIHRFTLLAWAAGLVHTIIEGTDTGTAWYIALLVVTTAPVVVLLAIRVVGAPQDFGLVPGPPARPAPASPDPGRPALGVPRAVDPRPRAAQARASRPSRLWSGPPPR